LVAAGQQDQSRPRGNDGRLLLLKNDGVDRLLPGLTTRYDGIDTAAEAGDFLVIDVRGTGAERGYAE
jgi:hypothetical protein